MNLNNESPSISLRQLTIQPNQDHSKQSNQTNSIIQPNHNYDCESDHDTINSKVLNKFFPSLQLKKLKSLNDKPISHEDVPLLNKNQNDLSLSLQVSKLKQANSKLKKQHDDFEKQNRNMKTEIVISFLFSMILKSIKRVRLKDLNDSIPKISKC